MDVKQYLESHGATQSQLDSKTTEMVISGLLDEEIASSDTVRAEFSKMREGISAAKFKSDAIMRGLEGYEKRFQSLERLMSDAEKCASDRVIDDQRVVDGVNAFTRMLESTRDVFGEDSMTESVICAAIEAASYGFWRSVMGSKHDDAPKRKKGMTYL